MDPKRKETRLTTILFADVVNYRGLTRTDQDGTHERVQALLHDVIAPRFEEHFGKIVKSMGDGWLVEFPAAVNAVQSSIDIQRTTPNHEVNVNAPSDQRIVLRIGINVGDMIVEPDDVFGDGVIIARRLQEAAEPGEILVSSTVKDSLAGTLSFELDALGETELEKLQHSISAFRVLIRPGEFLFDYEKDVIKAYVDGNGNLSPELVSKGCPKDWPKVDRLPAKFPNPVPKTETGDHRSPNAMVTVDARQPEAPNGKEQDIVPARLAMTFPEAGPREFLRFSDKTNPLKVGILVSGGIAPGINAVIQGIVERHRLYESHFGKKYDVEIFALSEGFRSLTRPTREVVLLDETEVKETSTLGGSLVPTAREDELLPSNSPTEQRNKISQAANTLQHMGIDILYVIGGEGSMRAAHAISEFYRNKRGGIPSIVGIPKTMDNDILWVWQSFGFMSAVERAREAILQLHTEITSNPRLCIIQLFGSDSGFVASHAALGSSVCDLVLIPEMDFTIDEAFECVMNKLEQRLRGRSPYAMIVMAESAIPIDAETYLTEDSQNEFIGLSDDEKTAIRDFFKNGRRLHGQTPDALRSGGLKIISRVLQKKIRGVDGKYEYWKDYRVFVNEPRHLVRSMPPSATDVAYGQRLGTLAVDNAMAGYHNFMVSQWLTEYVLVPLPLVVLGRKRVPLDGMFWKAVIANTGQKDCRFRMQ